jgi:hypothetical protein
MSGDWIKMRAALQSDPKVLAIGKRIERAAGFSEWLTAGQYGDAVICDVALRYAVTGALHNVWCNANEHARNGVIDGADLEWIDSVSCIDGFGSAMASVGWASVVDGVGLVFPKFDANNTSAAERQRRYREKKRNASDVTRSATVAQHVAPREEKRREDLEDNRGGHEYIPPPDPQEDPEVIGFPCAGEPCWFQLRRSQVSAWAALYVGLDIEAECRKAAAWIDADTKRRKTAKGMKRFLVGWLGRATDRGGNGSVRGRPTNPDGTPQALNQALFDKIKRGEL